VASTGSPGLRLRRRLPAGDGPDMGPRHRVVGNAREQAAQFDRGGQLAFLLEEVADRGGNGVGDQEHGLKDAAALRAGQAGPASAIRATAALNPGTVGCPR
jgi:hypothetical protein